MYFWSRLLVYSAESGVSSVQFVLSRFSMRLFFCFAQAKTFCMYGCIYLLTKLVFVWVDVLMMSFAEAMT